MTDDKFDTDDTGTAERPFENGLKGYVRKVL